MSIASRLGTVAVVATAGRMPKRRFVGAGSWSLGLPTRGVPGELEALRPLTQESDGRIETLGGGGSAFSASVRPLSQRCGAFSLRAGLEQAAICILESHCKG